MIQRRIHIPVRPGNLVHSSNMQEDSRQNYEHTNVAQIAGFQRFEAILYCASCIWVSPIDKMDVPGQLRCSYTLETNIHLDLNVSLRFQLE